VCMKWHGTKNWPTVFESVGREMTRTFRDHTLRYLFCARRSCTVTRRARVGGRVLPAGGVAPRDEQ